MTPPASATTVSIVFDALTISCDIAPQDHQAALEALRGAGLSANIGYLETAPIVIAVFPNDGSRPALADWDPLEHRVRAVLAERGIAVKSTGFGINSN